MLRSKSRIAAWLASTCLLILIGARAGAESLPPPTTPAVDEKKSGTKVKSDKEKGAGEKPAPPAGEPQK